MTDLDRLILDTYRAHATEHHLGSRTSALVAATGLSETRCYQRLVALTRDPQAWAYDAATVGLIERRMVRGMRSRKVA